MSWLAHHGSGLCVIALEEAIARHSKPDICNTAQGSHFTCFAFIATLKALDARISRALASALRSLSQAAATAARPMPSA